MRALSVALAVALASTVSTLPAPAGLARPGPLDPHYMMMVSSGCSGSSWVWQMVVTLLDAHHLDDPSSVLPAMLPPSAENQASRKEWLENRNCHSKPEAGERAGESAAPWTAPSVCTGLDVQCVQSARLGDTWSGMNGGCGGGKNLNPKVLTDRQAAMAKIGAYADGTRGYVMPFTALRFAIDPDGWDMLTPRNTRVASSTRTNVLDQLICKVKDCFVKDDVAVRVDEAGRTISSDGCFQRRQQKLGSQPKVRGARIAKGGRTGAHTGCVLADAPCATRVGGARVGA